MKKAFCFALCIALLLLCVGCNADNTPDASADPAVWLLKKQTMVQANGDITVSTFSYNDGGQMIAYETRANGTLNSQTEIGYDERGYKNYEKSTSTSGFVMEVFLTNDASGRVLTQRTVTSYQGNPLAESGAAFEYTDEYGSFVQTVTSGSAKGNTVTVTKDAHGNELSHVTSNGDSIQYENKYDGDVLVEQISKRSSPSGLVVTKISYEYDENGNNVKTTTYDDLGVLILTHKYEYFSQKVQVS